MTQVDELHEMRSVQSKLLSLTASARLVVDTSLSCMRVARELDAGKRPFM